MGISQLFYVFGSFIAGQCPPQGWESSPQLMAIDYNETHVLNPRWPPHAKFHNGQTMSLSVLLSTVSLYLLFRTNGSRKQHIDDLFLAAWVGAFYMFAGLTASLYPGTAWTDPEFRKSKEVDETPQMYAFSIGLAVLWAGWAMERKRLTAVASRKRV